ncbi:ROK family protein [Qipengyuania sp. RANM35]|uniref:ROK family protein n=1 Tax=Qipengyuania sp. RANM35 TaxID=3068635 RepID=UPI0034DB4B32
MSSNLPLYGAIEAGGTKFVLGTGTSPTNLTARHTIATRTPAETLSEAAAWFHNQGRLSAIGIATFGPAVVDPKDGRWGRITNTPKPGWADCDLAGFFGREFGVPIGFDTDVNGAALAESRFGAGEDANSLAYVTVGTGIGGGLVIDGKAVHGAAHPEMGHIFPRRHESDAAFEGVCPTHGDCLEGLASGPAILRRWGKSLSELPDDHEAHAVIAHYLAHLCHTIFAMSSAEVIVLGGGVMNAPGLLDRVRAKERELDRGYLPAAAIHRVVKPSLGDDAGIIGALCLAMEADKGR